MLVLILALIISSCEVSFHRPPLQMSPQEIGQLDSNEGIVVGSLRVFATGYANFYLETRKKPCGRYFAFSATSWDLRLSAPFHEQVFVTKMPAGQYCSGFWAAEIPDSACGVHTGSVALNFTVRRGEVLYIGSWTFMMPPAGEDPEEQLLTKAPYSIEVEDRHEEVLALAATTHGSLLDGASTALMTPSAQRIFRASLGYEERC